MSWIKKTESELEDEKKEKLAFLAKQKKQQEDEFIPTHPYNALRSSTEITNYPSWLNKATKDNIKKNDNVKTMDNSTKNSVNSGWKQVSYSESLQNIAMMVKSANKNNNSDKLLLLADIINK